MERRKFTREFKLEAVRLIKERGVSYAQASHDLSVHQSQLRSWVKALADDPRHAFPGQGQMKPEQLEIAQLKREVIRLKAERDILKKAYFAKEFDVKFGFVAKHRGIWPAEWLCGALGVSRGGFYAWLRRPRSRRSRRDEELGAKVRSSFLASDRTYGARRVWHDMLAEGVSCDLHRIERLMRLQALKARPRRRRLPPDLGERQVARQNPRHRRSLRRYSDRQSIRCYPSGVDEHASCPARRLLSTRLRISKKALSPHAVVCRHALYRRPDHPRPHLHRRAVEGDAARTSERRQHSRRRGGRPVTGRHVDHALRSSWREFLLWPRRGAARKRRASRTKIAILNLHLNKNSAKSALCRCCRKSRPVSVRRPEIGSNKLRNEEFLDQLSPCGPTSEMFFFGPVSKIIFRQHRSESDR